MSPCAEKARLAARIESRSESLVELCRSLVRIDSTNPPGDTAAIVEAIEAVLDATAGIEHRRVIGRAPAVNLVARVPEGRAPAAGSCSTAISTPFRLARHGGSTLHWGRTWRTGGSTAAEPAT